MAKQITKSFIKDLAEMRSSSGGTSLITYLIPSGYQIALVSKKLTTELNSASNIKDKNVRKDVITSLKVALGNLKNSKLHTAPENGLVLCSGIATANVDTTTVATQYYL